MAISCWVISADAASPRMFMCVLERGCFSIIFAFSREQAQSIARDYAGKISPRERKKYAAILAQLKTSPLPERTEREPVEIPDGAVVRYILGAYGLFFQGKLRTNDPNACVHGRPQFLFLSYPNRPPACPIDGACGFVDRNGEYHLWVLYSKLQFNELLDSLDWFGTARALFEAEQVNRSVVPGSSLREPLHVTGGPARDICVVVDLAKEIPSMRLPGHLAGDLAMHLEFPTPPRPLS